MQLGVSVVCIITPLMLLCVEAYRICSGIMSHFLSLKICSKIVYTGMYNFMKEIPATFFAVKITVYIDLQCFIIDQSWRVCCLNYNTLDLMYHYKGQTTLSNVWPPRSFVT